MRDLAQRQQRSLVELNFERDPALAQAFTSNDPRQIIARLSLLGHSIELDRSLLFLDEVQGFGEVLAKLRWFYEELPELPVVAAGSLLELTLRDHRFSMPVGRIEFHNVEPLGFLEYLTAHRQQTLLEMLQGWTPAQNLLDPLIHTTASAWLERFSMVGGMPSVIVDELSEASPLQLRNAQKQLTATYRADFPKYGGRVRPEILDKVLVGAAHSLGQKFVYAKADNVLKANDAKAGLELLCQARICQPITHTSANGLPLAAEAKESIRKLALLDVSLLHALMNTPAQQAFPKLKDLAPDQRARIFEQITAQELRWLGSGPGDPNALYYWHREGGRAGEVDHVAQRNGRILPIELKSGASGSMKSLHQFMFDKKLEQAVRIDTNPPSVLDVNVRTTQGDKVRYQLVSIPLYLLWDIERIVQEAWNMRKV